MSPLQTPEVSLAGEGVTSERALQARWPPFGRGDGSGPGEGALVLGGRALQTVLGCDSRTLGSQRPKDANQIADLDCGSKPWICSSFPFPPNGPVLELEKGV